jgi:hypothetical protein
MNNELLTRVTNARETKNTWYINIWSGKFGSIFGRQAHDRTIYVNGTVAQINSHVMSILPAAEEITRIGLLGSLAPEVRFCDQ